ncbi:hypothetical protein PC121_g2140 [Phytophthora cactorum]|nr:hypothetical protein PC120_g5022 [Phytophthora cactorum]KAG3098005.1 hypothetical protein PC121_g2140 [Phytophthora cactorum]KAG4057629.1 hypothetical protein PC123_g7354 [Phytophthora cactorum]
MTKEIRLRLKVVEDINEKLVMVNKELAASYEQLVASIWMVMQRMENTIIAPEICTSATNPLQLLQPPRWPGFLGISAPTYKADQAESDQYSEAGEPIVFG